MMTLIHGLRTTLVFIVAVPVTALLAVMVVLYTLIRPTGPILEWIPRFWGKMWCRLSGVKVVVRGLEEVDPQGSYVVISNHRSSFDIFAHFAALPFPIRFLAKAELFKIPLFGTAMRRIGIIEVDRGAGRAAHRSVNRAAAKNLSLGRSLMIYPEGTRSRDGTLGPFKKGAFVIARNLGVPVLPTAIKGSRSVWAPGAKLIRPGRIDFVVLPAISTQSTKLRDMADLSHQAFAGIAAALDEQP